MPYTVRPAEPSDAAELLGIYAPFVRETTVSFEDEVPGVEEFARRIESARERFCYLVAIDNATGKAAGYAYYGTFRERSAYRFCAETSIYLAPEHRGRGLGSLLLEALEALMALQGIRMSEACITSDNLGSIEFHKRHGYRICGEHTTCGFKLGQWLSVTWMEKRVLPLGESPELTRLSDGDLARVLADVNEKASALG